MPIANTLGLQGGFSVFGGLRSPVFKVCVATKKPQVETWGPLLLPMPRESVIRSGTGKHRHITVHPVQPV